MKLSRLLSGCDFLSETGGMPADREITSIHSRSQDVKPGGLFIAVKGYRADGHDYIKDAIARGAAAIIAQKRIVDDPAMILVRDSRKAMSSIAATFYGDPSASMVMFGVTGTNGKTTITSILESILKKAGHTVGVIGTINWRFPGKIVSNPVTTPDSIDLQFILHTMKKAGVTHVVMEVSSHGIDLFRVNHCRFDVGIFTNLTQDHLDFHNDMETYFNVKRRLFTEILPNGPKASRAAAVINVDDAYGRRLAQAQLPVTVVTAGQSSDAQVQPFNVSDDIAGLSGTLRLPVGSFDFKAYLTGGFNLENIQCAAAAAHVIGIAPDTIRQGIEALTGVPGRLERVALDSGRYVFVDYAHTPGALERILSTLKERAPARLISVFGCGGDRDRTKRPIMGRAGLANSDLAIITSDNPRSENPLQIIEDILEGIRDMGTVEYTRDSLTRDFNMHGFHIEPDRKRALETAMAISRPGDIIVAAGKGHETYQVLAHGTIDFDDRLVLNRSAQILKDREAIRD